MPRIKSSTTALWGEHEVRFWETRHATGPYLTDGEIRMLNCQAVLLGIEGTRLSKSTLADRRSRGSLLCSLRSRLLAITREAHRSLPHGPKTKEESDLEKAMAASQAYWGNAL